MTFSVRNSGKILGKNIKSIACESLCKPVLEKKNTKQMIINVFIFRYKDNFIETFSMKDITE